MSDADWDLVRAAIADEQEQPTGLVYCLAAAGIKRYKLGFSADDVEARCSALNTGSPVPLRVLGVMRGTFQLEGYLQGVFSQHRVHREWFDACADLDQLVAEFMVPLGSLPENRARLYEDDLVENPDGSWRVRPDA